MVLGTSSCHMLNSAHERFVPGVAGIVRDGILPGFFGYETGQAAVGRNDRGRAVLVAAVHHREEGVGFGSVERGDAHVADHEHARSGVGADPLVEASSAQAVTNDLVMSVAPVKYPR